MGRDKSPQYVVLTPTGTGALPPPPPSRHRHRSSDDGTCCCLFCYCCCCCVFILLIACAGAASLVFLNPKPPSYSIDHLSISSFNVSSDLTTIHTNFSVSVRAKNPNERIGISYGQDSSIALAYRNTDLCSGKWPSFYHGYHNTTVVNVVLDGKSKFDQGMLDALRADQQSSRIPLDVSVKVPVQLRIAGADMMPVTVSVRCELVVDNLEPDKKIGIKTANCNVDW